MGNTTQRACKAVAPKTCIIPVFMDDGVEEFAISPAGGEVITAQALVTLHHALRPQQQLLLGSHII